MPTPPDTRADPVTETLHGDEYTDPYRWLEADADDPEVADWTDRQNEYADAVVDDDLRAAFEPAFEGVADLPDYGAVTPRGGRYVSLNRDSDADRARLLVRETPGGEPRTLAAPDEFEGEASVDWFAVHPSGDRVAYGVARGGDEQYDLRVVGTDAGDLLADCGTVGRTGARMFAWADDGFYYVATGDPSDGAQMDKEFRYRADGDERVLATHDDQHVWPALDYHEPTGTLVVSFGEMSGGTRVTAWRGEDGAGETGDGDEEFETLFDGGDAEVSVELTDDRVFLRTDAGAPRGRVLGADAAGFLAGETDPETVVPEGEGVVREVTTTATHLVVHSHREAASRLAAHAFDGTHAFDVDLPGLSTVHGVEGDPDADDCFYVVESFDRPASVVHADLGTGRDGDDAPDADRAGGARAADGPPDPARTRTLREPDLDLDLDLAVERRTVVSADGTEVPLFVAHRADRDPSDAPTALYAYGGFRVNLTPTFSRFRLPFLAAGGVYAQACARGGSEFGEPWHEAGMRAEKRRTFEDVEAAADHLVEAGVTTHDRLGVMGGSNGGLTVGAVLTRDPTRWGAAVCAVPLLDMLRFHRFLLGESWTPEYGHPEVEAEYEWLREYSPYQHVEDREYPPTLFTTAVGDSRVHPSHARKTVARLQNEARGGPFCLRTETDTGHGLGKSVEMELDEQLDRWTFLAGFLGVSPADVPDGG
ncbi:prolyl oligopeptidase family serine peptidase [Candidatus Halobonum tyrrellensis]|uniref:prolyl oligopeptidase n=1 Tax=Candidatus Halobonum tyrrellensis G22 TaxID=1324957 RepID=V4HC55_9EURY|nr:prolyl oligopeptidase family serine peptidase [Candidatus Halobonum tyrrellensis]ESP87638.1 serine protease, S9A family peptidase [Candidatus Halobonum tyrrellensis G22]